MNLKTFFAPSWKKIGWLFLVFFVAQLYLNVIMPFMPGQIVQNFINFILNPGNAIIGKVSLEQNLATPIANTVSLAWNYVLATILAKEVSKEK